MSGLRRFMWHGSDRVLTGFGGPDQADALHLGSLEQAAMRSGGKYLHLVKIDAKTVSRTRDRGSDRRDVIRRARRKGVDAIVYLNRYEGIQTETLTGVLDAHPSLDLDAIPDAKFRRLFPEARDSVLLLDPSAARVVGCYPDIEAAKGGYTERVVLGGHDAGLRSTAAVLPFERWIGRRDPLILDEAEFGPSEMRWIDEARERLIASHARRSCQRSSMEGYGVRELPGADGISFLKIGSDLVAMDAKNEAFLGGISRGMIYVAPEYRGRGVAVSLHVCAEETRCVALKPSHFSSGGFAARRAAHRILCQRAFDRGDPLCDENRETYALHEAVPCEP